MQMLLRYVSEHLPVSFFLPNATIFLHYSEIQAQKRHILSIFLIASAQNSSKSKPVEMTR